MEELLSLLERVRKTSNGYRASCPVHGEDKDPSLSITHRDGKVLMHCFSCGSSGMDVIQALGLTPDYLFDEKREFVRDPDFMLKKTRDNDDCLILIAKAAHERGERLRYSDRLALREAFARSDQRKRKGIDQIKECEEWRPDSLVSNY